jgi:predicted amidohydrolase
VLTEAGGWKIGLTICYDLRFPELYRLLALAGVELVTVPANFTLRTGMAHWHALLRARAIENALYVARLGSWASRYRATQATDTRSSSTPGEQCSPRRRTARP